MTAIMGGISNDIDSITRQIEELNTQISNLNTSTSSGTSIIGTSVSVTNGDSEKKHGDSEKKHTTLGTVRSNASYSKDDLAHATIKEMYANAHAWHTVMGNQQDRLEDRNAYLGGVLKSECGIDAERVDGNWYVGNELLFDKYKKYTYHTGGFVGQNPLKPGERYIKAKNNELILTNDQQDSLAVQLDRIEVMADAFKDIAMPLPTPTFGGGLYGAGIGTINNTTNNSRPIEVHFGDTIISGSASPETVRQHERVSEKMVNDFARLLGVKW